MIDEDRLSGLSEDEVIELLYSHGRGHGDDLDHVDKMLVGFEALVVGVNESNTRAAGYFIGAASPYMSVTGLEAGFWDNLKESTKILVDGIKKVVKEIIDYYGGDGQRQLDDADKKSAAAIETMEKLDGSVPVPEGSPLLSKEKYFKAPGVDSLDDEQLTLVNNAIATMNGAVDKLADVKKVGDLVTVLKGIRDASISSAKSISEAIKKSAGDASTAADKISNPTAPSESENNEVQTAKKQEIQEQIKDTKTKGNSVKKIAGLRNKFLAPALVVVGVVAQVEKLKENKEFKG